MISDGIRFMIKSSLLSSALFLIGLFGLSIDDVYSISILEIAFTYLYTVPIFLIIGIPISLVVMKLVRNISNKIIKEFLSQISVTLLAFFIMYILTEFLFGGAYLAIENILHAILLSYFSVIASLIGIRLSRN
jgi:hypothetical protein